MTRRLPPRLLAVLGAVFLVVAALGSVLFGAIVVFANLQASALPRPAGLAGYLHTDALDSSLLLRSLASMPDRQVLGYVLAAGRSESAFAILSFGDTLSDPERANALAALAPAYASAGDTEKAAVCYGQLVSLAVLGVDFHDYQKATLLLQAGDGYAALGRLAEAEESYDRAAELARLSPIVQPSIRVQLLRSVAAKYALLGRGTKAQAAAADAEGSAFPTVTDSMKAAMPPSPAPAFWQNAVSWTRLQSLQSQRLQAAIDLIAAMESHPQGPVGAKRQALEQALLAEDAAQEAFYQEQRTLAPSISAGLAVSQLRVNWLTLKWRVAARGFGLSIVADWESHIRDIEAALKRTLEEQYTMRLELATMLPDALQARQRIVDVMVDEIKLGRLGLFPNSPELGLAGDLTEAIRDRIALREDGTLFVVPATRSGTADIVFAFATADQLLRRQP